MTERYAHVSPDAMHAAARGTDAALPRVALAPTGTDLGIHLESGDGRDRGRTDDQRRVKAERPPVDSRGCEPSGQPVGNAREAALAVLAGAQAGSLSRAALDALADAVLDRDEVRLAVAVRDGGEHAVRRAIELAALVLSTHLMTAERQATRT